MPIVTAEAVKAAYRRYAPVYDLMFGSVLDDGRRVMASIVQRQQPRRILEVGVGTGLTLNRYPLAERMVGVDISQEMLAKAGARASRLGLTNVELVLADAERLPFEDASFDCVTLPYVLSVTPDPQALIGELRRVCTPDGQIYVLNHFANAGGWRWAEALVGPLAGWIGFDSRMDMGSTVGAHDWHVVDVHSVNLMGLSKLVVLRNRA